MAPVLAQTWLCLLQVRAQRRLSELQARGDSSTTLEEILRARQSDCLCLSGGFLSFGSVAQLARMRQPQGSAKHGTNRRMSATLPYVILPLCYSACLCHRLA